MTCVLDQISGPVPMNGCVCPTTRNSKDGGIQSSRRGPDVWKKKPSVKFTKGLNISYRSFPLDSKLTHHPDLFVINNSLKNPSRRKRLKRVIDSIDNMPDDVKSYLKPIKMIPAKDHRCLIVVVTGNNGLTLSTDQAKSTPKVLEKTICLGSLTSAHKVDEGLQYFFSLPINEYDRLCSDYKDGLDLEPGDWNEQIDNILRMYKHENYSALSMDKIVPEAEQSSGRFHHFTRIYAGDGSPSVDSTFKKSSSVEGFDIYYKCTDARDYSEYPPLSTGFFNSSTHSVQIQPFVLPLLRKALGSKGMFMGGRSVMSHQGSLSYVGPRKNGAMRQPTVAEGPLEEFESRDEKFWYHRNSCPHSYFPFAQQFINFIVGATTLAAYYLYPYMARLYPATNSSEYRKTFCPSGTVAVDFC